MKISQIMTRDPRTCGPQDGIHQAARIMADLNVGAVPVVEGGKLVGIITDRDIVLRAVATQSTPKVGECMTHPVITATPDMDAHDCARVMAQKQIRRLPVVEGDRVVGIVALGDLATVNIHVDEAGNALSHISEPARPGAH